MNKLSIRGTTFHVTLNAGKSDEIIWVDSHNPEIKISRKMWDVGRYVDADVVRDARLEILSTFPYKRPDVKTLNSWLESSTTLKQYVIAQHPINAYIVLNFLFEPPLGQFIEMLLVKLGEI